LSDTHISPFGAPETEQAEPLDPLTRALSAKLASASRDDTPLVAARALEDLAAAMSMRAHAMREAPEAVIAELQHVADLLAATLERWHREQGPAAVAVRMRPEPELLLDVERAHVAAILERCSWRINGKGNAAERLGLHPNTLRFRLKKLGLSRPESLAALERSV
jgi:DNA-binding NtrC family response regulator